MDEETYLNYISELDKILLSLGDASPGVSPTHQSPGRESLESTRLFITKEMDVEKLSKNDLLLTHGLLHLFHNSKSGKGLERKDVERLHLKVTEKMTCHDRFDKLDDMVE